MPYSPVYQNIDIKPLSGLMDTRSMPDSVPAGAWRYRQNVSVNDQGRTCRRAGWQRYRGEKETYNNEDLHDQLLSLLEYYDETMPSYPAQDRISVYPPTQDAAGVSYCGALRKLRAAVRQPITFLFPAISTSGERKLLAGTQNRLYALNESRGNWKVIADAYGGTPATETYNGRTITVMPNRRWQAAQVRDAVIFTNNFDPVLVWLFDQPTFGCGMQAVSEVSSLAEISVTKAGVVAAWKGVIFLADLEMEGQRFEHRVIWSDFEKPTGFVPGVGSVANHQDLDYGQKILAMKPLNDVLLIYTTKSIWQCKYVGGEEVFAFTELYSEPENSEGCLAYRHTLVSTGQQHVYLGRDGVYAFDLYQSRPERVEWMHRASSEIFGTISETHCENHIGYFNPALKEYWISWIETASVQAGNSFPVRSLVYNTQFQTDDFVDEGFTAFCGNVPDDRASILDWLLSELICLNEELPAYADIVTLDVKEGGYCTQAEAKTCNGENASRLSCLDRNLPIWTKKPKAVDGREVEDYDQPVADEQSLCAVLGDLTYEDLCQECAKAGSFVMASATDWALKQYGGVYYREVTTGFDACGEWTRVGYDSIIRSAALDFGWPKENKNTRSLNVEYEATQVQVVPSALEVRLGYSAQAVDSNLAAPGSWASSGLRPPPTARTRPPRLKCFLCRSSRNPLRIVGLDMPVSFCTRRIPP